VTILFYAVITAILTASPSVCTATVFSMPKLVDKQYTMQKHRMQCFWGEQETHYDMEKTVAVQTDGDAVKIAVITA
jgi:hypothetical protein